MLSRQALPLMKICFVLTSLILKQLLTERLSQIERLVNEKITEFLPVTTAEVTMKEAEEMGAMALFGEKIRR